LCQIHRASPLDGVWLDFPAPDRNEIEQLVKDSYLLVATKRLAKLLATSQNQKS
jgi:hypothetical protein